MDGYAIITAGFSVLEGLIWAISVSVLLKPRFFSVCTTTIILFLYTAIRNLTGDFFHYESYLTLIFYIINFIGIFVLYTGSLKDVFFLFALLNVGMIFMEGISFNAFGPMRFSSMASSESQLMIPKITGMFIYPFIQIGHAFLLKQIVSKWSSNIVNKFYIFLISQPVLAFIAMNILYINHIEGDYIIITEDNLWPYRVGILLFILIVFVYDFILFYFIRKEEDREMIKEQEMVIERNLQYYKKRKQEIVKIRRIVHDSKNHLLMMENMVNKDPEKVKKYLELVEEDILSL